MSDEPKDGGPAFPVQSVYDQYGHYGLSLRDYFAAAALTGMAGTTTKAMHAEGFGVAETKAAIVRQAYGIADAMLIERADIPPIPSAGVK